MPVAPPAPVTRQPVPWDPWCWLEIQIATATGTTGDPDRVGYWQTETPDTTDPRYTTWVADSVVPPPAGQHPAQGYGEWVQGNTGIKWARDWNSINWRNVDCDTFSATFATGSTPWDWNDSPGNGTLRLNDPDHTYFPAGPGSGAFDDIGVNTPVRVVAHLTDKFNDGTGREPDRVLINGLIRSIDHELSPNGTGTTTINFSEPHVLYGRVNRKAIPVAEQQLPLRMYTIHDLSDDPQTVLLQYPAVTEQLSNDGNPSGPNNWGAPMMQATEVAADLWTEMCRTANSAGMLTVNRIYETSNTLGPWHPSLGQNGSPRIHAMPPLWPGDYASAYEKYGTDVRILTEDCSPPDATFTPYTVNNDPTRAKVANCPTGTIRFGHDDSDLANVVSIAASGGTAVELTDQASIDRWYRHTYQRHDLIFKPTGTNANTVAWRTHERLRDAVFHISDCDYFMAEPRDFEFALGASPSDIGRMDHPPLEPSKWIKLDWGWVSADLRVTKITHQITPAEWTVTHSYEVHNPITSQGGSL